MVGPNSALRWLTILDVLSLQRSPIRGSPGSLSPGWHAVRPISPHYRQYNVNDKNLHSYEQVCFNIPKNPHGPQAYLPYELLQGPHMLQPKEISAFKEDTKMLSSGLDSMQHEPQFAALMAAEEGKPSPPPFQDIHYTPNAGSQAPDESWVTIAQTMPFAPFSLDHDHEMITLNSELREPNTEPQSSAQYVPELEPKPAVALAKEYLENFREIFESKPATLDEEYQMAVKPLMEPSPAVTLAKEYLEHLKELEEKLGPKPAITLEEEYQMAVKPTTEPTPAVTLAKEVMETRKKRLEPKPVSAFAKEYLKALKQQLQPKPAVTLAKEHMETLMQKLKSKPALEVKEPLPDKPRPPSYADIATGLGLMDAPKPESQTEQFQFKPESAVTTLPPTGLSESEISKLQQELLDSHSKPEREEEDEQIANTPCKVSADKYAVQTLAESLASHFDTDLTQSEKEQALSHLQAILKYFHASKDDCPS